MTTDPREAEEFFLEVPAKLDDPFPDLAWLVEQRPVLHHQKLDQWFLFRYDDVRAAFADQRLSANRLAGFVDTAPEDVRDELRAVAPFLRTWAMMKDAPDHTRLRHLLQQAFTPGAVRGLRNTIAAITSELLAPLRSGKPFDLAGDYAFLLPAYVLSEFMGVHPEDRGRVVQWSVDFVDFFNVVPITGDTTGRMVRSTNQMREYTRELLAERDRDPREDFLGVLASARSRGEEITEDEIVGNAMLLLIAGHVAVRNLIGNAVWLLLTHPDQHAALLADPSLADAAITETLRYEPPVTLIPRIALEASDWNGHHIPAGALIQLSIAAANRDPARFQAPGSFNITHRHSAAVLSHGHGPHACLGALLAREQARVALQYLTEHAPGLRLDPDAEIRWYRNAGNRGPELLRVTA